MAGGVGARGEQGQSSRFNDIKSAKSQTQRQGLWMRTFIDVFMAVVVLCAGGIVGAALLGVLP